MIFSWWLRLTGVDLIIISKMNEIASLKNLLDYFNVLITQKDEEIKRLTDLILTEHGVILRDTETRTGKAEPRILNKKSSWPQRQRDLERADAVLSRSNQQAKDDKVKEYWEGKNKEALKEDASKVG